MSNDLNNVRIWVNASPKSADFRLIINVVDAKGLPIATIGQCEHEDSKMLHALLHAYRMGRRNPLEPHELYDIARGHDGEAD